VVDHAVRYSDDNDIKPHFECPTHTHVLTVAAGCSRASHAPRQFAVPPSGADACAAHLASPRLRVGGGQLSSSVGALRAGEGTTSGPVVARRDLCSREITHTETFTHGTEAQNSERQDSLGLQYHNSAAAAAARGAAGG
jgi:hypothetical protein